MILLVTMGMSLFIGLLSWFIFLLDGACSKNVKRFALTLTFIFAISLTGVLILESPKHTSQQLHATEHIVALQDNMNIEGRFYIRSGYIEENLYYHYMVDLGNRYKANKVVASDSYIYETEEDPRVEWWETRHDWWIFHSVDNGYVWHIYVPNGTILTDYNIDLQ